MSGSVRPYVVLACGLLAFLAPGVVRAQINTSYRWENNQNGSWSEATKWSPDGVPGAGSGVIIHPEVGNTTPFTVTAAANNAALIADVLGPATLALAGDLALGQEFIVGSGARTIGIGLLSVGAITRVSGLWTNDGVRVQTDELEFRFVGASMAIQGGGSVLANTVVPGPPADGVTVEGAGSKWEVQGSIPVSVSITNGGLVKTAANFLSNAVINGNTSRLEVAANIGDVTTGLFSDITLQDGTIVSARGLVGNSGSINRGAWNLTGDFSALGLTISNGGKLASGTGMVDLTGLGIGGSVDVSDENSRWDISGVFDASRGSAVLVVNAAFTAGNAKFGNGAKLSVGGGSGVISGAVTTASFIGPDEQKPGGTIEVFAGGQLATGSVSAGGLTATVQGPGSTASERFTKNRRQAPACSPLATPRQTRVCALPAAISRPT